MNTHTLKGRLCALLLAAAATTGSAAYAHHAISLDYDAERTGTVEGVVDEIFWANPHVHYYLSVTTDEGSTEIWDMEAPNISVMTRRGISRDTIRVGERISITGTLGRDGTKRILATTILKEDGTVVMGGEEYGE